MLWDNARLHKIVGGFMIKTSGLWKIKGQAPSRIGTSPKLNKFFLGPLLTFLENSNHNFFSCVANMPTNANCHINLGGGGNKNVPVWCICWAGGKPSELSTVKSSCCETSSLFLLSSLFSSFSFICTSHFYSSLLYGKSNETSTGLSGAQYKQW